MPHAVRFVSLNKCGQSARSVFLWLRRFAAMDGFDGAGLLLTKAKFVAFHICTYFHEFEMLWSHAVIVLVWMGCCLILLDSMAVLFF